MMTKLTELTDAELDAVAAGAPAYPGYGVGTALQVGGAGAIEDQARPGLDNADDAGGLGDQGNVPGSIGPGFGQRTASIG